MLFCLSGPPEVRGTRRLSDSWPRSSASPSTSAGLTALPHPSTQALPSLADAPPASFSSFSAPWAVFSDLTQVTSSVTGASHPHHGNRQHPVSICFTWFDEGRRKDIFSFPSAVSAVHKSCHQYPVPQPQLPGAMESFSRYPVFEAASRQAEIGKLAFCTDLRPMTPNIQEMLPMVNERRELRLDFYFPIWKKKHFSHETLFCLQCHFSWSLSFKLTFNFRKLLHLIKIPPIQFESRNQVAGNHHMDRKEEAGCWEWLVKGFKCNIWPYFFGNSKLSFLLSCFDVSAQVDGWLTVLIRRHFKPLA